MQCRVKWLKVRRSLNRSVQNVMAGPPEITEFTRIYLAVFFSLVALFYTVRIIRMKRSILREVVFPGQVLCPEWWNHMLFRCFRVGIWMLCVFRAFFPSIDNYIGLIAALNISPVVILGNLLLTIGFVFTILVHFSLGGSWRSGIDPAGPERLISTGYYRYSRNPMFLGVAVAQVGFFLVLPSLFSLVCLVFGLYALVRQVRSEEDHLEKLFPGEYAAYTARVRRWL